MKEVKKIVLFNVALSIALYIGSMAHTVMNIDRLIEMNPLSRTLINTNLAIAFIFPILVILGFTYVACEVDDMAGLSISSIFLGFTAFDFWTHVYLILNT